MIKLPFGVDINNLIDDLRIFSWEAADILIHYSNSLNSESYKNIVINPNQSFDPVTIADLKVNNLILDRIKESYPNAEWEYLTEEDIKVKEELQKFDSDWLWVLDPLDGTKDFIQGSGNYAMHLALNYKNVPYMGIVLIPSKDELWISNGENVWCENRTRKIRKKNIPEIKELNQMTLVTSKNHSNNFLKELIDQIGFKKIIIMGSIGCKIASILRGDSDIYISLSLPKRTCPKDWDFAAPDAILKAGGGCITNIYNERLSYNKSNFEQRGLLIATSNRVNHKYICKEIEQIIIDNNIFPPED